MAFYIVPLTTEKSSYERTMKKVRDLESEYFRTLVEW